MIAPAFWASSTHCAAAFSGALNVSLLLRRCISGMDHHCLMMDTCIGAHNLRAYLAFLVCLCAGCAFYVSPGLQR